MRLISVIHYPEFGGPHNQALRLAPALAGNGIETVVVLPVGPAAERLMRAGVTVHTVGLGRMRAIKDLPTQAAIFGKLPLDLVRLGRVFREYRPDVVQVDGVTNPQAAIVARSMGIPVVWQLLGTVAPMVVRRVAAPLINHLADALMLVGDAIGPAHSEVWVGPERTVVFRPPVETELFHPRVESTLRSELGISPSVPVVGTVSNINPQKGHEFLIASAALARHQIPNLAVIIAGHIYDSHRDYFEELCIQAKLLGFTLGEDLFFLGARDDVPNVLQSFDCFALASVPKSEGTPTVLLEAMATGRPVIATDVGAVSEIVENGINGYIVQPERPDLLADRIVQLLQCPETRARMGRAGRHRVETEFSFEQCVTAHRRAYEIAIQHRRGSKHFRGAD